MSGLTECTPILDHYAKQRYLASLVTDSKHQHSLKHLTAILNGYYMELTRI